MRRSVKCIKCENDAGELSPEMRRAKERMGMPLTPPKVCPSCLWESFQDLVDDDGVAQHEPDYQGVGYQKRVDVDACSEWSATLKGSGDV